MRTRLIAAVTLTVGLTAFGGLANGPSSGAPATMPATHDDCPHCAGVQTANADGKCPMCGMQVKDMKGHKMEPGSTTMPS